MTLADGVSIEAYHDAHRDTYFIQSDVMDERRSACVQTMSFLTVSRALELRRVFDNRSFTAHHGSRHCTQ